ncbi:MAG: right-handed parallel beta-helix repeat-containing protein [Bacteroidales bacterium]|nr:right-handed parallel beta-helix repeat-containing protein [Bacteroidales bacterium]
MKLLIMILISIEFVSFGGTFVVTNTNDSGAGSLRQAITDANAFGPDNIVFNIPNTDLGYDAVNGVWVISPSSPLPYFTTGFTNLDGDTQTDNQGNTNGLGPEIVLNGSNTILQGLLLASPSNLIKGIIVQNFTYGIQIYGSAATNNSISNCLIGTDYIAESKASNEFGVTISDGASNNDVYSSIISGNITAGVAVQNSNNNRIFSNKIGCCRSGVDSLPNGMGVLIDNSSYNTIGGTNPDDKNVISGNYDSGILINASASTANEIFGNYIGTNFFGNIKLSNSFGIIIANSGGNFIGSSTGSGKNIISGNHETGILINGSGAENNIIINNYIGVGISGTNILANHTGVLIKTNAHRNIIGGTNASERNVISGNIEIGVYIESADSNIVIGNFIGPDATGSGILMSGDTVFQANGIELNTVAKYNRIGGYSVNERNIISGNRVYGMIYYGQTSENYLIGNYIGTDVSGTIALPNATGICVDASSNNNYIFFNLLSGNISYGIFLVTNGTFYNQVKGNLIGTNAMGNDSIPNDVGLLLGGGARWNTIGGEGVEERNIISGNRYAGVEIADNLTDYNVLENNYIGTDISGTFALANGNGVGITSFPSGNILDGNLISGNLGYGVIIYEHSDSCLLINNLIGCDVSGENPIPNTVGIVLATGANGNIIGQETEGNTIAFNDSAAIIVIDEMSLNNTISANSMFNNGVGWGIDIFPFGPNANDAGDTDVGPNTMMNCPEIIHVGLDDITGLSHVYGTLDTENPELSVIELFIAEPGVLNIGEGKTYLGKCNTDIYGNWHAVVNGINLSNFVTATATNAQGNTSEFSANIGAQLKIESNNNIGNIKVYPNPAKDYIIVSCNKNSFLQLYNSKGEICFSEFLNQQSKISLNDYNSGLYLLKISNDSEVFFEKICVIE